MTSFTQSSGPTDPNPKVRDPAPRAEPERQDEYEAEQTPGFGEDERLDEEQGTSERNARDSVER